MSKALYLEIFKVSLIHQGAMHTRGAKIKAPLIIPHKGKVWFIIFILGIHFFF